jgi:hypothetical protein
MGRHMRRPSIASIGLALSLLLFHDWGGMLFAQTPVPTPQQLDQLLAPVALYPDTLLAQITTASTNPQEILDVDAWLQQNAGLTGAGLQSAAQQQGFDPAFVALVTFPQVLGMMAQNVDDYAAIGAAFSSNQASVMDSVQRLRAQAQAAGSLISNPQQQVLTQNQGGQQVIVIQPANPQVVYVPVYDPTVVYVRPSTGAVVAGTLLAFGAGIAIGALISSNQPWGWGGWGWNWGRRTVIVNHNTWVVRNNYYRPPRYTYRPRPVVYGNRPGYGGNWGYRPPNYRPPNNYRPPVSTLPVPNRPPNYRPGGPNQPPQNRPPNATLPARPVTRPPNVNPTPPPQNRPPQNRPPQNQPPQNQPQNRPPQSRPQNRPPQNQPENRPPQSRPPNGAPPNARPANPPANSGRGNREQPKSERSRQPAEKN